MLFNFFHLHILLVYFLRIESAELFSSKMQPVSLITMISKTFLFNGVFGTVLYYDEKYRVNGKIPDIYQHTGKVKMFISSYSFIHCQSMDSGCI